MMKGRVKETKIEQGDWRKFQKKIRRESQGIFIPKYTLEQKAGRGHCATRLPHWASYFFMNHLNLLSHPGQK